MISLLNDGIARHAHDNGVFYNHCGMNMSIWRAHTLIHHVFGIMVKGYVNKLIDWLTNTSNRL